MVDGIGFATFIKILTSLEIEWVIRTDNDIFKVPYKEKFRFAGIQRCIDLCREFWNIDETSNKVFEEHEKNLIWLNTNSPEEKNLLSASIIKTELEKYNFFLSNIDLENDLYNSSLADDLKHYFIDIEDHEIVQAMQKRKASFMFDFIKSESESLSRLANDPIAKPLFCCENIIDKIQNDAN